MGGTSAWRSAACSAGASWLASTAKVVAPARAKAVTMSPRWPAQVNRTTGTR